LTQNYPQVRKLAISSREDGQRVDNFLIKQLSGVPKSHIYRLLRSGQVRVNGGRVKPERKLVVGDEVRVPPVRAAEKGEAVRPPDALLKRLRDAIVHEDEH
jgi:23S rRNA pseudouridine955/2504/2580 synthase